MQKAQAARLDKRAIVRFLVLLAGFGLVATLLLWLKFAAADVFSLTLPAGLQDFVTLVTVPQTVGEFERSVLAGSPAELTLL